MLDHQIACGFTPPDVRRLLARASSPEKALAHFESFSTTRG